MSKYRVYFYNKYSNECRSVDVEADNVFEAEDKACEKADEYNWSINFRIVDVEKLDKEK